MVSSITWHWSGRFWSLDVLLQVCFSYIFSAFFSWLNTIVNIYFPYIHVGYGVRLSGSSTPHAGRVEIGILGIWGSIYNYMSFLHGLYFSSETQRIICRQLGFNDSILGTVWVQKGSTIRPRWFSDYEFHCLGKERNIRDCISSPQPQLTRRDYYNVQDLGVVCKPNVSQIDGEFWT